MSFLAATDAPTTAAATDAPTTATPTDPEAVQSHEKELIEEKILTPKSSKQQQYLFTFRNGDKFSKISKSMHAKTMFLETFHYFRAALRVLQMCESGEK